jgi:hypothetical protein
VKEREIEKEVALMDKVSFILTLQTPGKKREEHHEQKGIKSVK